jgi:hypothetical protein
LATTATTMEDASGEEEIPTSRRRSRARQPGDPTPAKIRRICAKIQATWTPAQEYARRTGVTLPAGLLRPAWTPPEIGAGEMYEPRVTPEMAGRG